MRLTAPDLAQSLACRTDGSLFPNLARLTCTVQERRTTKSRNVVTCAPCPQRSTPRSAAGGGLRTQPQLEQPDAPKAHSIPCPQQVPGQHLQGCSVGVVRLEHVAAIGPPKLSVDACIAAGARWSLPTTQTRLLRMELGSHCGPMKDPLMRQSVTSNSWYRPPSSRCPGIPISVWTSLASMPKSSL
jgi:hypothetical protein